MAIVMGNEYLEKKLKAMRESTNHTFSEMDDLYNEAKWVEQVAANTHYIIKNLDEEFESITKLNKTDVMLLFLAVGMQIARQYLVTQFPERKDNIVAAKETKGHIEEHSNRRHRYYNPSIEEIISNPVPFDSNIGANGALSGGGRLRHRVTALGHDPIIGLIVGTSNIATSTLTNNRLESFHIYTKITNMGKRDTFRNRAKTSLVFEKTGEKLLFQGLEGKKLVGTSFIKEIIHLKSDINTKHSLPLPIISAIDGSVASKLAEYGADMANLKTIASQSTLSILINSLIAMIHGAFAPDELSKTLYEVRTRKILSYSNVIASSSNLIFVGVNGAVGNKDAIKNLDIGGLLVTCYRVASDAKFIVSAKQEFIERKFFELIDGDVS